MNFPTQDQVNRVKNNYPEGTRVQLVKMEDPYARLKPGSQGLVDFVDDTGTIFVNWDCGSKLGVVYGEDIVTKV
jgi:hypothetical protein